MSASQIYMRCLVSFDDTATTEIYTLSLHDPLPILPALIPAVIATLCAWVAAACQAGRSWPWWFLTMGSGIVLVQTVASRSEEHTSEFQSRQYLVCRRLVEKKI